MTPRSGAADGSASASSPRQRQLAFALFASLLLLSVALGVVFGRPVALLALPTIPVLIALRSSKWGFAVAMLVGGAVVRVAVVGTGMQSDQIETTQAALQLVLAGASPYGHAIVGTSTANPYPYGPLALLAYIPGVWTEVAASVGIMALLARRGALVSLAFYAACPLVLRGVVMGLNDTLPGLLMLAALLVAPRRPAAAGVLLAAAIAVKPYALAFAPTLLGIGGLASAGVLCAASALLWSPLLAWGPGTFLRSLEIVSSVPYPAGGLGMPWLRLLAAPMSVLAALTHEWRSSALAGTAVFLLVMVTGNFLSFGYLLAILPIVAIAAEAPPGR